jgi:hypothetical protein
MRTVVGYLHGAKVWSENVPNQPWLDGGSRTRIGGSAIEPAPQLVRAPSNPDSKAAIAKRERRARDYHASILKGWETRRGAA